MRPIIVTIFLLAPLMAAGAGESLLRLSPAHIAAARNLGENVRVDGDVLIVEAAGQPGFTPLLDIADPGIEAPVYALHGEVRYEGIDGTGYLQLDSDFGARGSFFSKTLASHGPLASLSGNSGWRPFVLPFNATADGTVLPPTGLSLGVYLPGSGTVALRNLELRTYAADEDPLADTGQWFDARTGAWIGAIGGGAAGLWGGLVGYLSGRRKARGFVLGSARLLLGAGTIVLLAGIAALATGQPYTVYFPLLLLGGILVFVIGGLARALPKRYEEAELAKTPATDT